MAKRKRTRKVKCDTLEYFNSELEFIRDKSPNLVTVAASLMPFRDAFYRVGVGTDPDGATALLFDIVHPSLPEGFDMIAFVNECDVYITQSVTEDDEENGGDVVISHRCNIRQFWEFLRTIPRSVGAFAELEKSALSCPQCGDGCEE